MSYYRVTRTHPPLREPWCVEKVLGVTRRDDGVKIERVFTMAAYVSRRQARMDARSRRDFARSASMEVRRVH